ncbi:unnamed protein product [Arabis nemorensis]|uniref:Uncharacterized protein n=1 Tax=Arabis nemorensis TaxID=586526 RepID=A0A565CFH7_9BRAS|nr:unnamed protein product [Arabis nemorensis]
MASKIAGWLNMFLHHNGLRKVEKSEQWEYAHDDHFVRGKPELTHEIEKAFRATLAPKTLADLDKSFTESPPYPSTFFDLNCGGRISQSRFK